MCYVICYLGRGLVIIAKKELHVPRPREVRDTFQTLINDNNAAIGELRSSITEINQNREPVKELYGRMIERFAASLLWPSLDEEALGKFKDASGGKADFVSAYNAQMTESLEAQIRVTSLTATHGEADVLGARMRYLQQEANKSDDEAVRLGGDVSRKSGILAPVEQFNAAAPEGAPKLAEGSIEYFNSKSGVAHVWSWLFNGHYRRGRSIMKDVEKAGTPVVALQKELVADQAAQAAAQKATKELIKQKLEAEKPYREIENVAAKVVTEEQVVEKLKAEMLGMLEDRAFFNKAAAAMGESFPAHAIELRAKLEGFDKLEAGARKSIKELEDTNRKLQEPMSKLNKAISKKPGMNINVDLDKANKGVKAQQTLAKHKAGEIKKANKSINDYKHSGSYNGAYVAGDMLDMYLNFMIIDMLVHGHGHHHHAAEALGSGVDPAVVNETLGISGEVAADVGIPDVDALTPALSGDELAGLGDAFNGAAVDVGDIDVGAIEVPDFELPDFEIPDISLPDIDLGGIFDAF